MSNSSISHSSDFIFQKGNFRKQTLTNKAFRALQKQVSKVKHPNFAQRASQLELLTEIISELTYEEYRLLVGTLNVLRSDDNKTWEELSKLLSQFREETSQYLMLSGLIRILEEVVRLEQKRSTSFNHIPILEPFPKAQTPARFCINLMSMVRLFYPTGVNILNPCSNMDEVFALNEDSGMLFKTKNQESVIIRACTNPKMKSNKALFSISLSSPFRPSVQTLYIGPREQLLIGRNSLILDGLMGFPFQFKVDVDLSVNDGTWSRASLLLTCTEEGNLYLFDRASRNPFKFELFNLKNHHTSSFMYDPRIEASTPLNLDLKDSVSMSIGRLSHLNHSRVLPKEVVAQLQDHHRLEKSSTDEEE